MKVEFDPQGILLVVAENNAESLALDLWWSNFHSGTDQSVFGINTTNHMGEVSEPEPSAIRQGY